jgi:hypothetical protein
MKAIHTGAFVLILAVAGCSPFLSNRAQSPESSEITDKVDSTLLVGDVATSYGPGAIAVEGIGLVVGLPGTGSDPEPDIFRAMLEDDMRRRNVENIKQLLARNDTSLVLVRGYIKPGAQKGDNFDLEIRVPNGSETKSLRGGYLMQVRLTEKRVIAGDIKEGNLLAVGEGPVLVDPGADEKEDRVNATRGRVLGGGRTLHDHKLGLLLRPDYQAVRYSYQVGQAVNRRFHTYQGGSKENVATPKNNEFIELAVHPQYRHNIARYLRVVRALPLTETATDRLERLETLERQLLDPLTSARAALRLEAIGNEAAPVLLKGLESDSLEVRFYSAEALAYLNHEESGKAAQPLAQAAREESALRVFALTALSAMSDFEAHQQLMQLLHVPSAETRYGAFRSLWAMNKNDPVIRGEMLGRDNQFSYHILHTSGPPMIHVTANFRPEIVIFGNDLTLQTPLLLEAGKRIMITAPAGGPVTVSRFAVGEPDQKRQVAPRVDDVIRACVELGANYPDVVQMLQQAARSKSLGNCRLEIDAIPQAGRNLKRPSASSSGEAEGEDGATSEDEADFVVSNPLPDLFPTLKRKESDSGPKYRNAPVEKKRGFLGSIFRKMGSDG